MKKLIGTIGWMMTMIFLKIDLNAHCQLPCGIYHDDMVFDQIDQYAETMYKGISVLNQIKINNMHDQNEVIRWVLEKEKESNEIASLITIFFLQQKIKPGEPETPKRLASAHKLLFLLVAIKQNTDLKFVKEFTDEWETFKTMFHVEGYECKIEMMKQQARENKAKQAAKAADENHTHDHDHDHDHDHQH
jgi:nickel superoxide dismutase